MPSIAKSKPQSRSRQAATPSAPLAGPLKKGDHVFLVDGSGYIFRAYHALPPLTPQVGRPAGRRRARLLQHAVEAAGRDERRTSKPTHLAVVFDKSEKTFRNEFYPAIQGAPAGRRRTICIPQFPLIREAVRAFDIPCLEQAGFEADDLIATYARLACEAEATTTIVSSDKDLMQLVNDCVTMYDTMKDKRRSARAEVIEKFGVGARQGDRGAGADRRLHRQRAGRAGHRRQDRGAAHRRIRRSRNAAEARRRDQAGQAPPDADRQCRAGAHLEAAGHARPERRRSRCRSTSSRCTSRTTST